MTWLCRLRFLTRVAGPSPSMLFGGGGLVFYSIWLCSKDGSGLASCLSLCLLFQMFAAATGFRAQARRGHLDPALVGGTPRWSTAAGHLLVSVSPGLVVWGSTVAGAWLCSPHAIALTWLGPSLVAMAWVSSATWAASLPAGRYSSGVLWILLTGLLLATGRVFALRSALATSPSDWTIVVRQTGAVLLVPWFLVAPAPTIAMATRATLATSVCVACLGLRSLARADVPLEH